MRKWSEPSVNLSDALPEMPESYVARISETLAALPVRGRQRMLPGRLSRRMTAVLAAAAILLIAGTALAVGYILNGKGSSIDYFEKVDSAELAAKQDRYERSSDAVGVTLTGAPDAPTMTVNNIAIIDDVVTVFFTASSPAEIPADADAAALSQMVSDAWILIDGVRYGTHSLLIQESVLREDAHTLSWMAAYEGSELHIPAVCKLTVGADTLFGTAGVWRTEFDVDLTETLSEARVSIPGQKVNVNYGGFDHEVTVSRVTVDKNGGQAVLAELCPGDPALIACWEETKAWQIAYDQRRQELQAQPGLTDAERNDLLSAYEAEHPNPMNTLPASDVDFMTYVNFAIVNDKGESLNPRLPGGWFSSSRNVVVENTLYFNADYDTAYVRLIPILGSGEHHEAELRFDALNVPVTVYDGLTVTLTAVTKNQSRNELTISYRETGITTVDARYSHSRVTDGQGKRLTDCGSTLSPDDPYRDDATGVYTETITFLDGYDLSKIGGILFAYDEPILDEANAVAVSFPTK